MPFINVNDKFNDRFNNLLTNDNNLTKLLILVRFPGFKMDLTTRIKYAMSVIEYNYTNYPTNTIFEIEQLNKLVTFIDSEITNESPVNQWNDTKNFIEDCELEREIQKINQDYTNNQDYTDNDDNDFDVDVYESEEFSESCY